MMPVCIGATCQQFKVTECQTNKHMNPGGCDMQPLTRTVFRPNRAHSTILYMRRVLYCYIRAVNAHKRTDIKQINQCSFYHLVTIFCVIIHFVHNSSKKIMWQKLSSYLICTNTESHNYGTNQCLFIQQSLFFLAHTQKLGHMPAQIYYFFKPTSWCIIRPFSLHIMQLTFMLLCSYIHIHYMQSFFVKEISTK